MGLEKFFSERKLAMKKLMVAMILTFLIVLVMAGPALAAGVSATDLGRCANPLHAPGTGAASHIWVPEAAWENLNGGESGLHFMTP